MGLQIHEILIEQNSRPKEEFFVLGPLKYGEDEILIKFVEYGAAGGE